MSGTMRAVTIRSKRMLEIAEHPVPRPIGDEVLVRVHAAGLNRADLWQLAGGYPAPPGSSKDIPGLEFAGVVESVGPSVTRLRVGDRVFGIVGGGAQAEYVTVSELHCVPVPAALGLVEAGGVPETFIAAHDALITQAQLAIGEAVLIHAVGSGVGTSALQIAKARGCRVIGTARAAWKLERAQGMGLDRAILMPSTQDSELLLTAIRDVTDAADVVIDLVGGAYLEADIAAARERGRIIMVSTIGGDAWPINLRHLMNKRLTLRGTVLRGRPASDKATAVAAFAADVCPLLAQRVVRPIIEQTFPLEQARRAYDLLDSDATFGKIALVMSAEGGT